MGKGKHQGGGRQRGADEIEEDERGPRGSGDGKFGSRGVGGQSATAGMMPPSSSEEESEDEADAEMSREAKIAKDRAERVFKRGVRSFSKRTVKTSLHMEQTIRLAKVAAALAQSDQVALEACRARGWVYRAQEATLVPRPPAPAAPAFESFEQLAQLTRIATHLTA